MIRQLLSVFTLSLILSGFLSCSRDDEKDTAFKYIDLEYFETFTQEGRAINFHFSTVETYPCSNFTLRMVINSSSQHTDIQITDIEVPDVCITTMGPATHNLMLGSTNDLNDSFTLWVNNKRHEFKVIVEDERITIEKGSPFENHLFFAFDSLMRIPQGTVWGYAIIDPERNKQEIFNALLEAFYEAGAQQVVLPDGNYYYFRIKDEKIVFGNVKQQSYPFYFSFDGPFELLIEAYDEFLKKYEQHDIQLRLFNTSGERFVM